MTRGAWISRGQVERDRPPEAGAPLDEWLIMEIALVSSDSTGEQDQRCWNPTIGSRLDAGLFNFHHQPVLVSSNKRHFEFHTTVLSLK